MASKLVDEAQDLIDRDEDFAKEIMKDETQRLFETKILLNKIRQKYIEFNKQMKERTAEMKALKVREAELKKLMTKAEDAFNKAFTEWEDS